MHFIAAVAAALHVILRENREAARDRRPGGLAVVVPPGTECPVARPNDIDQQQAAARFDRDLGRSLPNREARRSLRDFFLCRIRLT
jgi:hypothetical protein